MKKMTIIFEKVCIASIRVLLLLSMSVIIFTANASYSLADNIAAIVDEQPITSLDVDKRARLMMILSGFPNTPEVMSAMRQQALHALVEGRLILSASARANIKVSDEELHQAENSVAAQNKMTRTQLLTLLSSADVQEQELHLFFKEQVSWTKFLEQEIKPSVHISDEEVEQNLQAISKILDNSDENVRVKLSEIVLYVSADDPQKTAQSLEQLSKQLKADSDFAKLARDFSQSASRQNDGVVGWVYVEQLAQELKAVVKNLEPGQISSPIILGESVIILKLLDKQVRKAQEDRSDRKQEVFQYLYRHKLHLKIKAYLNALRKNATTSINNVR